MPSKLDEFVMNWQMVKRSTARELSEPEYRIIDQAMESNDPFVMKAAIEAVGDPPTLRMIRQELLKYIAKKDKQPGNRKSWWTSVRSQFSPLRSKNPRSGDALLPVAAIADRLFFAQLWKAIQGYFAADLDSLQRVNLAAAFHSGQPKTVLQALRELPPTTENQIVIQDIQRLYPRAL
jgi:hypothetical protein